MEKTTRLTPKRIWQLSVMSDKKHKKYIPYNQFNKVLREIIIEIDDMLLEGKSVYLPHKMGSIRLKKFKPKKKLPDWKATKRLWEVNVAMREKKFLVLQDNAHTSGWRVRLTWSKYNCAWTNQGLVVAKRTRGFERKLAWKLKTDSSLIDTIKE